MKALILGIAAAASLFAVLTLANHPINQVMLMEAGNDVLMPANAMGISILLSSGFGAIIGHTVNHLTRKKPEQEQRNFNS